MPHVSTKDRGAVRVIIYANATFGPLTAAGSAEMFDAVAAVGENVAITGGLRK